MQAIETKFIGPTNFKGSRVTAKCQRGSTIIDWDHSLSTEGNHEAAAKALIEKFVTEDRLKVGTLSRDNPWSRPRATGVLANGNFVHVYV